MTVNARILTGIGVCAGSVSARIVVVAPAPQPDTKETPTTDFDAASARVREALQMVADGLTAKAKIAPKAAKAVLEAGAMMAVDPGLASGIDDLLRAGKGVTVAVHDAVDQYATMFESLGGYMAERKTDLRDIRDRVISRLLGHAEPGIPTLAEPAILVARDLAPAQVALLSPATCLGIITEEGGPTSHTAILVTQLGIPMAVQVSGAASLKTDTLVALDGGSGVVIVEPRGDEIADLEAKWRRRSAALSESKAPGATSDGHPVSLLANIGTVADALAAKKYAVEGVGLFRTEFLFLDRESAPTVAEQRETYTAVLEAFHGRPVVVRTLDAGSDKPLKFADLGEEENPALGQRGLRLGIIREDILDAQLEALAAAYFATGADLLVMAPMIANVTEARWFAQKVRSVGLPTVGVMIEIPAAALRAQKVLAEVDFASLGTNDLQQYTMAADRTAGELARLLHPWEPAVLDVVAAACKGAALAGKPIGVCGEAGGDPALALVLVGLGVSSLSMAPNKVSAVRTALAHHSLAKCQELAALALAADTWESARDNVLAAADSVVRDLSLPTAS